MTEEAVEALLTRDAEKAGPVIEGDVELNNLERIADLATNIGEDAVYLAEGKQIKHHSQRGGARVYSLTVAASM